MLPVYEERERKLAVIYDHKETVKSVAEVSDYRKRPGSACRQASFLNLHPTAQDVVPDFHYGNGGKSTIVNIVEKIVNRKNDK